MQFSNSQQTKAHLFTYSTHDINELPGLIATFQLISPNSKFGLHLSVPLSQEKIKPVQNQIGIREEATSMSKSKSNNKNTECCFIPKKFHIKKLL